MEIYEASYQFNTLTGTNSYDVQFIQLFSFNFNSTLNPKHIIESTRSYNMQFSFPCTGSTTQPSEKQSYFFS